MRGYRYGGPRRRIRFSEREVRHILLALAVLILAFALVLSRPLTVARFLEGLILSGVAVPLGFLLHELGHKVVAQRYGHWAEFRAYNFGLVLAILTAFVGFLFAAPGAVVISGSVSRRENGRISAAGPGVNLAIGLLFLALWWGLVLARVTASLGGLMTLRSLAFNVAFISLFLGVFNMLPIPPLDGSKVLRWDRAVYLALLAPLVALLALSYLILLGHLGPL